MAALPREQLFVDELPTFTLQPDEAFFEIEKLPGSQGWLVTGPRIEQLAAQTYWEVEQAAMRAHRILEKMGVNQALREAGVEPGDTVFLHDVELEWLW